MARNNFFDPFSDFARSAPVRELEDWFRDFPFRSAMREAQSEPRMRVDISETAQAYLVKADLPGVKKEDIHVEIEGNTISITAETREEKEEKQGETVVRSERHTGRQFRSLVLPGEVDDAQSQARYEDGILHLTLPKKTASPGGRRIDIK